MGWRPLAALAPCPSPAGRESAGSARSTDTQGIQRGALSPPRRPPPHRRAHWLLHCLPALPLAPQAPCTSVSGALCCWEVGKQEGAIFRECGPPKGIWLGEGGMLALSRHRARYMDSGSARDLVRVTVANHGYLLCTLLLFSFSPGNSSAGGIIVSPGHG